MSSPDEMMEVDEGKSLGYEKRDVHLMGEPGTATESHPIAAECEDLLMEILDTVHDTTEVKEAFMTDEAASALGTNLTSVGNDGIGEITGEIFLDDGLHNDAVSTGAAGDEKAQEDAAVVGNESGSVIVSASEVTGDTEKVADSDDDAQWRMLELYNCSGNVLLDSDSSSSKATEVIERVQTSQLISEGSENEEEQKRAVLEAGADLLQEDELLLEETGEKTMVDLEDDGSVEKIVFSGKEAASAARALIDADVTKSGEEVVLIGSSKKAVLASEEAANDEETNFSLGKNGSLENADYRAKEVEIGEMLDSYLKEVEAAVGTEISLEEAVVDNKAIPVSFGGESVSEFLGTSGGRKPVDEDESEKKAEFKTEENAILITREDEYKTNRNSDLEEGESSEKMDLNVTQAETEEVADAARDEPSTLSSNDTNWLDNEQDVCLEKVKVQEVVISLEEAQDNEVAAVLEEALQSLASPYSAAEANDKVTEAEPILMESSNQLPEMDESDWMKMEEMLLYGEQAREMTDDDLAAAEASLIQDSGRIQMDYEPDQQTDESDLTEAVSLLIHGTAQDATKEYTSSISLTVDDIVRDGGFDEMSADGQHVDIAQASEDVSMASSGEEMKHSDSGKDLSEPKQGELAGTSERNFTEQSNESSRSSDNIALFSQAVDTDNDEAAVEGIDATAEGTAFCVRRVLEGESPAPSGSGQDEESNDESDDLGLPTKRVTRSTAAQASFERGHSSAAFRLPTNKEIREGKDYQCRVQELDEWEVEEESQEEYEPTERECCVWRPTDALSSNEINDYLSTALGAYGIEQDQALYILYWCDCDVDAARVQLAKRRAVKEQWSEDDAAMFVETFRTFGKRFYKIRQMLPHKTMKEIINYYYDNKKRLDLRSMINSLMEDRDSDESDSEDDSNANDSTNGGECDNCGQEAYHLRDCDDMRLCNACLIYFKNFHRHRPCVKSQEKSKSSRFNVKCPPDMLELVDSFVDFAAREEESEERCAGEDGSDVGDELLIVRPPTLKWKAKLEEVEKAQMVTRGNCVRQEHALRLQYTQCLAEGIDQFRLPSSPPSVGRPHNQHLWSYKEKWQALFAFQRYGKDFDVVAELLGTKTPGMVKSFYQELAPQIDEIIANTKSHYENAAKEYDFEKELKVEPPEAEVVDID